QQNLERLQSESERKADALEKWKQVHSLQIPGVALPPETVVPDRAKGERTSVAADGAEIAEIDRPVDFAGEVFPVLERSCFGCHGPEKQRSELRLDSKKAVFAGSLSGLVVEPGNGEASLLFRRAAGLDGE